MISCIVSELLRTASWAGSRRYTIVRTRTAVVLAQQSLLLTIISYHKGKRVRTDLTADGQFIGQGSDFGSYNGDIQMDNRS